MTYKTTTQVLVSIIIWIATLWIMTTPINCQVVINPVTIDIILENEKPSCDVYNNVTVSQNVSHVYAALGKKPIISKSGKINNYFVIDQWITIYVHNEVVWRIEYKGLRLPCKYLYDPQSNFQKYLSSDGNKLVMYDSNNGNTYVTDLDLWMIVSQQN